MEAQRKSTVDTASCAKKYLSGGTDTSCTQILILFLDQLKNPARITKNNEINPGILPHSFSNGI